MELNIGKNLSEVRSRIANAARRVARSPESIHLIAVSKTHPTEVIMAAVDAGQLIFGENRIQEAKPKIAALPARLRWHLIGHLQSNKVRLALPSFELIHGVDSLELLADIDRVAGELGLFPRILLQVNVSGEASKFGFAPAKLLNSVEEIVRFDRLQIDGLMTIPPLAPSAEFSRKYFAALRELRDRLGQQYRFQLPELSMGMSNDFEVAIEEGATMVRVGTAIFGPRASR
ncbi:MAG: YggS family pyridoxal phosphate-dependent enzyme [Verrucomicrobia bacterium]|nr:YggS family pyridoxal phosphate-dependent enzyme [Verrucomicrobiota bacterium]MBV9274358.1 YggS family pyridoxal phosphate-dependent enzyme [Verrucomicrobiota bacterium]